MSEPEKRKPRKLRRKKSEETENGKNGKEYNDHDAKKALDKFLEDIPADGLPNEGVEGVKEISVYEDQECANDDCTNMAVGKDIYCKRHGGNPVIQENLMSAEEVPSWILAKSKYNPIKHPINFINYSKLGLSETEIAAKFDVSVGTMRGWSEKFLEFNQAYEIGAACYESWWLEEGKANLDNRNYNTQLYKFLTGNKLGYSDKMESKNLNVTAGVLLVPGKVDTDTWEQQGEDFLKNRE